MVLLLLFWIVCGAFAYAIAFAEVQARFPTIAKENYRQDMGMAMLFGCLGPISLIVAFFTSGFAEHGLKWR